MTTPLAWILLLVAAAVVGATVLSVRSDPRRLANAYALPASFVAVWLASSTLSRGEDVLTLLVSALVLLSPLLAVVLAVFLIANGVTMARREGRSLGNLLSLLAGVGMIAAMAAAVWLAVTPPVRALVAVAIGLVLLGGWLGFLFVSLLLYTLVVPRLARRPDPDFVVVHGSGLIRGKVPRLLASRIDAGIAAWAAASARRPGVPLIMSGGQGADEPRAEAVAMAEYAVEAGVPLEALWVEDASATTEENLRFTRALVAERIGPDARGLAVTSSYHVLRTGVLARRVGLDVRVLGAPVARYFWPSAFLRECGALLAQHPVGYAVATALVCLPLPILLALAIGSQ